MKRTWDFYAGAPQRAEWTKFKIQIWGWVISIVGAIIGAVLIWIFTVFF